MIQWDKLKIDVDVGKFRTKIGKKIHFFAHGNIYLKVHTLMFSKWHVSSD